MTKNKIVFTVSAILVLFIFTCQLLFKINNFEKITLIFGAGGLLFSIWQILISLESAQESRLSKMADKIYKEIDEIRIASDKRDFYHEQQLGLLSNYVAEMRSHLEHHQTQLGHHGTLEQLLLVKDQMADLRASVAAIGRQGEVILKLEKLQAIVYKLVSADKTQTD